MKQSLTKHLLLYGIRHFKTDDYWAWAGSSLGEKKARELDSLRHRVTKLGAKKYPRDVKAFYDAVACPETAPVILSMKADAIRASGEAVAERLAGRKNILDLGCGTGYLSTWYAGLADRVTGVDFSEASIALAKKMAAKLKAKNARFLVFDLCADAQPDIGLFDAVVDTQTLSTVQNIPRALGNIKACLAPGGVLVSVPSLETARHARAYIRCLENAGFRLHSFEFIQYADCGSRGAYPVITASPQGKSIRVPLEKEYERIWKRLNSGGL